MCSLLRVLAALKTIGNLSDRGARRRVGIGRYGFRLPASVRRHRCNGARASVIGSGHPFLSWRRGGPNGALGLPRDDPAKPLEQNTQSFSLFARAWGGTSSSSRISPRSPHLRLFQYWRSDPPRQRRAFSETAFLRDWQSLLWRSRATRGGVFPLLPHLNVSLHLHEQRSLTCYKLSFDRGPTSLRQTSAATFRPPRNV